MGFIEGGHALRPRPGGNLPRPLEHPKPDDLGQAVEAIVEPAAEESDEGGLEKKEAAQPFQLQVVEDLDQITHDIRHVMEVKDEDAHSKVVVCVGGSHERNRDQMV